MRYALLLSYVVLAFSLGSAEARDEKARDEVQQEAQAVFDDYIEKYPNLKEENPHLYQMLEDMLILDDLPADGPSTASFEVTHFKCDDGYMPTDGLSTCDVSLWVEATGLPADVTDVSASCSATLKVTDDTGFTTTRNETFYKYVFVQNGAVYDNIHLEISFYTNFDPIIRAKLEEFDCFLDYLS